VAELGYAALFIGTLLMVGGFLSDIVRSGQRR